MRRCSTNLSVGGRWRSSSHRLLPALERRYDTISLLRERDILFDINANGRTTGAGNDPRYALTDLRASQYRRACSSANGSAPGSCSWRQPVDPGSGVVPVHAAQDLCGVDM
jgi:hypothetical protein